MAAPIRSYVALLRGINVGGKNVIAMRALASTFERMGLVRVTTYIQSGNVLFQTDQRDVRALEARIEVALKKAHRYEATVVLRTGSEMAQVIAGLPRAWKRVDPAMKYNVLFLRHEIDSPSILDGLRPKSGIETVSYRSGVLYWSARTSDLSQTSMAKLSSQAIYRHITVRNLNTTRKIGELLQAFPGDD